LLLYVEKEARNEFKGSKSIVKKMLKITGLFYFTNIILGGLYVITAVDGVFLGWLSLIHLLVGACVFLTLATTYLVTNLTISKEKNVPN